MGLAFAAYLRPGFSVMQVSPFHKKVGKSLHKEIPWHVYEM